MRRLTFALSFVALARVGSAEPSVEPLHSLGGELRRTVPGAEEPIQDEAVGSFLLESSGEGDLRATPGSAALELFGVPDPSDAGTLAATASRVNEARRVDPATGRPLRASAPADATCATGSEDACLPTTHCRPREPGFAPCDVAGSIAAFLAGVGAVTGENPFRVGPLLFNNLDSALTGVPLPPEEVLTDNDFSISELLANAAAGNAGANTVISQGLAGAPLPLVSLHADPCDGLLSDCTTVVPNSVIFASQAPTLNQVLTSQQQAQLGCGEFHGTNCELDGLFVPTAEASAWLQCFDADPQRDYGDSAVPEPCTLGFAEPAPACTRDAGEETVVLPGCRRDADSAHDPNVDGNADGLVQPLSGQPLASELAAVSFNTLMVLAAISTASDPLQPEDDEFDPDAPERLDGCSFRKPQLCGAVRNLTSQLATEAEDDPSGPPCRRWRWETGADHAITSATGSLADFADGTLHALGPERSRVAASELGVSFVIAPVAAAPEAVQPMELYGVPEPSALVSSAIALLAAVCFARRGRR